jgi:hypothetical protein
LGESDKRPIDLRSWKARTGKQRLFLLASALQVFSRPHASSAHPQFLLPRHHCNDIIAIMASVDPGSFLHLSRPLAPSSYHYQNTLSPLYVNIQPQVRLYTLDLMLSQAAIVPNSICRLTGWLAGWLTSFLSVGHLLYIGPRCPSRCPSNPYHLIPSHRRSDRYTV